MIPVKITQRWRVFALVLACCMVTSLLTPLTTVFAETDLSSISQTEQKTESTLEKDDSNEASVDKDSSDTEDDSGGNEPGETEGSGEEPGEPGDADGEAPDEGEEPDDGDEPDEGEEPDDGKEPDEGEEPDDGDEPDEGEEPNDGEEPDEGEEPGEPGEPDEGEELEEPEMEEDIEAINEIPEYDILTSYTVAYDGNGVGVDSIDNGVLPDVTYTVKSAVEMGMTIPYFELAGWNTEQDGSGEEYQPGDGLKVEDHLILYAQWKLNLESNLGRVARASSSMLAADSVATYMVTYQSSTTVSTPEYIPATQQVYYIKSADSVGISMPGSRVTHWSENEDGTGRHYTPGDPVQLTGNLTLHAQFEVIRDTEFAVTYDGLGQGYHQDEGIQEGERYRFKTNEEAGISAPTSNYIFDVWSELPDGTGRRFAANSSINVYDHLRVFSRWNYSGSGTIFITLINADSNPIQMTPSIYMNPGDPYVLQDASAYGFELEDHTFVGWRVYGTNQPIYAAGDIIYPYNSGAIYSAVWEYSGAAYDVIYDANGGTGSYSDQDIRPGTTYRVVDQETTGIENRGFEFTGWNTKADGSGTSYQADNTFAMPDNDVTLYAQWTIDPSQRTEVTYLANGGTPDSFVDTDIIIGSDYEVLANMFTKAGDMFTGWNTAADGSGTAYQAGDVINNITAAGETLYAQWTIDPSKRTEVTYLANGGTPDSFVDTDIIIGSDYEVLANMFTKAGDMFTGWNTAADGSGTAYQAGDVINNITAAGETLYAQWTIDPSKRTEVTYLANGGTPDSFVDTDIIIGSDYEVLANMFTKAGDMFTGWNTAADGSGTAYQAGDVINNITAAGETLYAQWTIDPSKRTEVTYLANGGTPDSFVDTDIIIGSDYEVLANMFTKAGDMFTGWNTAADGSGTAYQAGDVINNITAAGETLYAQWTIDPSQRTEVTYLANGGTPDSFVDTDIIIGSDYEVLANMFTKAGDMFTGWNTAADGSGTAYQAGDVINNITAAGETLYAQWTIDPSQRTNVTYLANGGTPDSFVDTDIIIGSDYEVLANMFTKAGDMFTGWNTAADGSGTAYQAGDVINNITAAGETLYAQWTIDPSQRTNVTYLANGGTPDSFVDTDIIIGSDYEVLANMFTKAGDMFTGWNTAADGSGTAYQAGDVINNITAAGETLYAQWTIDPSKRTEVTYLANGGTPDSFVDTDIIIGSDYEVLASMFTKAGDMFTGWNTAADGSGTAYQAGDVINNITAAGETLYAQWTIDPSKRTEVTYLANGGTPDSFVDTDIIIGSDYEVLANMFTKAGDMFTGWNTAADGSGTAYQAGDVINNITAAGETLYAQWTIDPSKRTEVTYLANGGTPDSFVDTDIIIGSDYEVLANMFTKAGDMFTGWNTAADGSGTAYQAGDVINNITAAGETLYAQWTIDPSKRTEVTYLANGGTPDSFVDTDIIIGSDYEVLANMFTKAGDMFTGWNTAADGSGTAYQAGDVINNITAAGETLYAQWTIDPSKRTEVTYLANGGTPDSFVDTDIIIGSDYEVLANMFTKAGDMFTGWNTAADGSGTAYQAGDVINNITAAGETLYAQWTIDPSKRTEVTYLANGGTPDSFVDTDIIIGSDYEVLANMFTKAGDMFTGWNTAADGSGTAYQAGDVINNITAAGETLYAQWTIDPSKRTEVTYLANGGTPDSFVDTDIIIGSDYEVLANMFTKAGDMFTGWNTAADGSGTAYQAGDVINNITAAGETLYAQWTIDPSKRTEVTYLANGGTPDSFVDTDIIIGSDYEVLANMFTKAGDMFTGWNTAADGSGTAYQAGDVINSITAAGETLYAQWTIDPSKRTEVTYLANGGTPDSFVDTDIIIGSDYEVLANMFTKAGDMFTGWNTAADGSGTAYQAGDVINSITAAGETLYAQWTIDPSKRTEVTYLANGGTPDSFVDTDIIIGSDYEVLANMFTKAGDMFTGWNTAADGSGTAYQAGDVINSITAAGETLYAQWTIDPSKRTEVTYLANGGTPDSFVDTDIIIGSDYEVLASMFTKAGDMFTGWNTAADGSGTAYQAGDVINNITAAGETLYAQWTIDPSKRTEVTYLANGGTPDSFVDTDIIIGSDYEVLANMFTKAGDMFTGWNTAADGSGTAYQAGDVINNITAAGETLYAQWTIDPSKRTEVTYLANGGTPDSFVDTDIIIGSDYEVLANMFTKAGDMFTGWNTAADGSGTAYQAGDVINNITAAGETLYAQWTIDPSKRTEVTYLANGGTPDSFVDTDIIIGSDYEVLANMFTKAGDMFTGWNTAADGSGTAYQAGDVINSITAAGETLYAQWTIDPSKRTEVTYLANGGTPDSFVDTDIIIGSDYEVLANMFTKAGDMFTGWNTAADGSGTAYQAGDVINSITAAGETLYAQWTIDPSKRTEVTYLANGGTPDSFVDTDIIIGSDYEVLANMFTKAGDMFTGWNTAADGSGTAYQAGDVINSITAAGETLYAQWTIDPSKRTEVTYLANGGTPDSFVDTDIIIGSDYEVLASMFTKAGDMFTGWNTAADGSGTAYQAGDVINNITAAGETLYAQWTIDPSKRTEVTYLANGGTPDSFVDTDIIIGSDYEVLANMFTKAGDMFTGWNTAADGSGTAYQAGDVINSITAAGETLYAQWTIDPSKRTEVTYLANGGTPDSFVDTDIIIGSDYEVLASMFTKAGDMFTGWNTAADGSGTAYQAGDVINNITAAGETLYAQWTIDPSKRTEVTYLANGGTPDSFVDTDIIIGSDYEVLANMFTKAGDMFTGWNTAADGSGTAYQAGDVINNITAAGETLYAQWTIDPSKRTEVTYLANGGTPDSFVDTDIIIGSDYEVLASMFTKAGDMFTGWNTAADGSGTAYQAGDVINNITAAGETLYAQWEIDLSQWATIVYRGNGGLTDDDEDTYSELALRGSNHELKENQFSKRGFDFDEWNMRENGMGMPLADQATVYVMSDMELFAQWKPDGTVYTVTYDPNATDTFGEVPEDSNSYTYGDRVTMLEPDDDFGRVSYWFSGWSTDADADPDDAYAPGTTFEITEDVTLYAIWYYDDTDYYVTYDGNYQTSGRPPVDDTPYRYNQLVEVKDNEGNLRKTNFVFKGWSFERYNTDPYMEVGEEFRIKADSTLYAAWRDYEGERIAVNYHPNSGDGDTYTEYVAPGSDYTFVSGSTASISKSGYYIESWNTEYDGSGTRYEPGQRIIMDDEPEEFAIHLYAQWRYSGEFYHTITFHPNTGNGGKILTGFYNGDTHVLGTPESYGIEKPYYDFVSWNTREDGLGTTYYIGDTFVMGNEDVTLYAQWEYNGDTYYYVTYDPVGAPQYDPVIYDMIAPGEIHRVRSGDELGFVLPFFYIASWSGSDGNTYYDDDEIEVNSYIVLTPNWELDLGRL